MRRSLAPGIRLGHASVLGVLVSTVSLAAVAWWFSRQAPPRLPDSVAGYAWLGLALVTITGGFALRGWRWHRIMRHAALPHRTRDAFGLTLVGYMGNNVLPARGGEILKIGLLGARTTARRREVLGTVIVERVLDAAVLVALFLLLTVAGVEGADAAGRSAALAVAAFGTAAIALTAYLVLRRRGRFERFAAVVRPIAHASRMLLGVRAATIGALTLVIWCVDGVTFMLIARAVDVELSVAAAIAVVVLAALASTIPAAPGYVGTFDAAILVGLNAAGVDGSGAAGVLVLARFMLFVPVTLAGLGTLVLGYGGLRARAARAAV